MTRQALLDRCLLYADALEDSPFAESTILRHRGNRKWFAVIFRREGQLCINLKCQPFAADFLRQTYGAISPGWHMNKTHWITVTMGGDVPDELLQQLMDGSHDLTG